MGRGAKLFTKWLIIGISSAVLLGACATEAEEQELQEEQALAAPAAQEVAATDAAVTLARGDGVLVGEPTSAVASELTVENAFDELAKWGMTNPGDSAAKPQAGTRVYLVTIVGYGVIPRPPALESFEECLETKVIVDAESNEAVFVTAKPSKGC